MKNNDLIEIQKGNNDIRRFDNEKTKVFEENNQKMDKLMDSLKKLKGILSPSKFLLVKGIIDNINLINKEQIDTLEIGLKIYNDQTNKSNKIFTGMGFSVTEISKSELEKEFK